MGGSFGKALVKNKLCKQVRGVARRSETSDKAVHDRCVDVASTDFESMLTGADVVFLASPVRTIEAQVTALYPMLDSDCIITDMGSVKSGIVQAMNSLPEGARAVGGHPMCGKEISGIEAPDPELFRERVWILTPTKNTDGEALGIVGDLTTAVGAKNIIMAAEIHDKITACVSHFPYLLSASLAAVTMDFSKEAPDVRRLVATGFKDTTRIASGNVTMMLDVLATNRKNVIAILDETTAKLESFRKLLQDDEDQLRRRLEEIKVFRTSLF